MLEYINQSKKKWKIILILITSVLFLLVIHIYALSSPLNHQKNNQKELIIGINGDSVPFNFIINNKQSISNAEKIENGQYVSGPEIKLMNEVAKELNFKTKFKIFDFDGLVSSVQQGNIDCAVSTISMTSQRRHNIKKNDLSFSKPYYFPDIGIVIRKNDPRIKYDNKDNIKITNNFDNFIKQSLEPQKPFRLIAFNGHFYSQLIDQIIEQNKQQDNYHIQHLKDLPGLAQATAEIENGNADGFLIDYENADYITKNKPNLISLKWISNNSFYKPYPYGIICSNNNQKININDINHALKNILLKDDVNKDEFENKNSREISDDQLLFKDQINHQMTEWINQNHNINNQTNYQQASFQYNLWNSIPSYLKSYCLTLVLAIDSFIIGFIISLLLTKIKMLENTYQKFNNIVIAFIYKLICKLIDIMIILLKGIPIGAQVLFFYYGFNSKIFNIQPFTAGLIILALNATFNILVIILSNIRFFDHKQIEAGKALGLKDKEIFKYIVFEPTLYKSIPSIMNQFIVNLKDTGFLTLIGVAELLYQAKQNTSIYLDVISPFLIISFFYLLTITITNYLIQKWYQKHQIKF